MQLTNYIPYGATPSTPADRVMRMHREFPSAIFFIINRLQQFELIPVIAKISFPQKGNFFIFNTNKMVSSPAAVSTTASSGLGWQFIKQYSAKRGHISLSCKGQTSFSCRKLSQKM
jgi:hypothetical protein